MILNTKKGKKKDDNDEVILNNVQCNKTVVVIQIKRLFIRRYHRRRSNKINWQIHFIMFKNTWFFSKKKFSRTLFFLTFFFIYLFVSCGIDDTLKADQLKQGNLLMFYLDIQMICEKDFKRFHLNCFNWLNEQPSAGSWITLSPFIHYQYKYIYRNININIFRIYK